MILKQHHFQTPERPKEEYYRIIGVESQKSHVGVLRDGGIYNKDPFQKDTAEWQSLYGEEPEPEWIDLDYEKPKDSQVVYYKKGNEFFACIVYYVQGNYSKPWGLEDKTTHWCDKATYDAIHQRWKDHQVKFKNFKKHIYGSGITEFSLDIDDKTVTVCFWPYSCQLEVAILKESEIIFEMTATEIHSEEFEMVLKNRNIKL